jgi:glycosyltransferase involved in cell wall biosynthesis
MPRPLRYGLLTLKTIGLLLNERPRLVFAQNPSIVLAALLCVLCRPVGYVLVIDRHSNFELDSRQSDSIKWRVFHILSRYTNRTADITIVTNEFLKQAVEADGGKGFVLQDKLPDLPAASALPAVHHPCAAFVCTFSPDEPIDDVLLAVRQLEVPVHIYVTGKPRLSARQRKLLADADGRVTITGFLPDEDYVALLKQMDFVIVLTTQEHTLVCGAYEAIALGKPVVLSDTAAIRDYFRRGAVYCEAQSDHIAQAICVASESLESLCHEALVQREWMHKDWEVRFERLQSILSAVLAPLSDKSR